MSIRLTPEQQQWLEAEVAAGHFASIEAAVHIAVADMKAAAADDLSWARPYLDEGRAAAERGETLSLEDHRARMAQRIAALTR